MFGGQQVPKSIHHFFPIKTNSAFFPRFKSDHDLVLSTRTTKSLSQHD